MKITLVLIFVFSICHRSAAQLKHYFNLNTIGHYEFFNQEKDRRIGEIAPSYKIEKDKIGLEVFYNWRGVAYYYGATNTPENLNKEGAIKQIISSNFGVAFHYKLLDKSTSASMQWLAWLKIGMMQLIWPYGCILVAG